MRLDNVTLVLGQMGSGKTTVLAKLAQKYAKKGYQVFSNVESLKVGEFVSFNDFGTESFCERVLSSQKSIYFCDEAGLEANNRAWKSFPRSKVRFLKMCRKYRCKCVFFSQSTDIDKSIRDLSKYIYIVRNLLFLSYSRQYRYKIKADVKTVKCPYASGEIITTVVMSELFPELHFRPRYYKLFDTRELVKPVSDEKAN